MNLEDLLAEAERLAKPCRYYRFALNGQPNSGYWHGVHADSLCASIERQGNWLNVYLDDKYQSGRAEVSAAPIRSARPLYRSDAKSLPPIEALFRFGSAAIDGYLRCHGWERDWGFNSNFKGVAAHQYVEAWSNQCPLYFDDVVAVEGGWNVPWPDGDWHNLVTSELVLWTFEESEPWVEVFSDGTGFSVVQRIT